MFSLRRSTDGVTANFYADAVGNLGTGAGATGTSLSVWLGSGVGYVAVWYDQSGRGNKATQSTTTLQPVYNVAGQYVDFADSKYMNFQAVITNNLTGVTFTLLHTTWQNIYQVQRVIPLSYGQKQDISWELYTNSGNYSGSIVVEGILITN